MPPTQLRRPCGGGANHKLGSTRSVPKYRIPERTATEAPGEILALHYFRFCELVGALRG